MSRSLSFIAALLLAACVGPEKPELTGRVEQFEIESAVVGDRYLVWVRLPPEYSESDTRSFPLVVQLDANLPTLEEFAVTAGNASRLEDLGEIPPVIVAGIGVPYDSFTPGRGRWRDFTLPLEHEPTAGEEGGGGAPKFFEFLRTEFIPQLEGKVRLDGPAHRALFGHSLGGLFAVYALSQHDDAQPVFHTYVAASPTLLWDGGTIYRYIDALLARQPNTKGALYLTAGTLEGPEMNVYADDFADRLRDRAPPGIAFESTRYSTDHLGTVGPSFADGLVFMKDKQ